jgi:hypothetical protein
MQTKSQKLNTLGIGLFLGIIVPLLTFFIVYLVKLSDIELDGFFKNEALIDAFTKLLSLCVLPNLGLFFIFLRTNRLVTARGILFATLLFTIMVLILKFL